MGRNKIPLIQLDQLVRQGLGVSEIARKLSVTKGAVSKALKRINVAVTKDIALRRAPAIVESKLDAMTQLKRINDLINCELDHIHKAIQTASDEERRELQDAQLRHVAEVRKQLGLLMNIAQTLYNAEEVAAFQQIVLEEIGHAAPQIQDRVLQRLNKRRFVGSTLLCP